MLAYSMRVCSKTILRSVIVAFAVVAALATMTLAAAPIHAAASTAAVAPICTVHEIAVHHHKISFRCLKEETSTGITPRTITEDCCSNADYDLEIDTMNSGAYCFSTDTVCGLSACGDYIGLGGSPYGNLYNVSAIHSEVNYYSPEGIPSCGSGWVLGYEPPYLSGHGNKFYYANCHTYDSSNSMFNGDDKVTQVYIDGH